MNCDQAKTELIAYLKSELDPMKRKRLEEHLARCPACRQQLEEARRLLEWTEAASDEAIVNKVDEIIRNAIKASASDIHFEPQRDDTLRVRYRIDGVLHEVMTLDSAQRSGVATRIKLLADMSIPERRVPQDGRMPFDLDGRGYDLRVSSQPFVFGEGFVMRILDRSNVLIGPDELGFSDGQVKQLEELLRQPCGMIIVTGPTGSGKTTTAYSMLQRLASPEKKTMTIEDPVEYLLPEVEQAQVSVKHGYTFPAALRSFFRHDPDIIMVGETRDYDTQILEVQAALTGHLVISSLHTEDALGAIHRLIDMQVEPFLISASLIGVVAQRLVRKVCQNCKADIDANPDDPMVKALRLTDGDPNDPMLRAFNITSEDLKEHKIKRGTGCEVCRGTGYRGRTGIFEVLTIDRGLASLISSGATPAELMEAARANGFRTMREEARQKVLDGVTTPEEALRVTAWTPAEC